MVVDPNEERPDPEVVATSLRAFMRLPRAQRSTAILMDVLGYSLGEIGEIMETSVPAVKSALHRGRTRLRELAAEPDDAPPVAFSPGENTLLAAYIERFNARDYDAVRAMLSDEVHLDLVNRLQLDGRVEVGRYFTNYAAATPRSFEPGLVDGRPAVLVYEAVAPDVVSYFIMLEWANGRVTRIRDFLYAGYALDGAEFSYANSAR